MALKESFKELRHSWEKWHIQVILAVHLTAGGIYWYRELETGDPLVFFQNYLQFISLLTPVFFLALFLLRRRPVLFSHQYNVEQLFWWSFCDTVIGSSLIIFWLLCILFWEMVSIIGILMVYINILAYLMLFFTLLLLVYVLTKKPWQAVLAALIAHIAIYGLTLLAPEIRVFGLNLLPHRLLLNFQRVIAVDTDIWEWLTPLMVTLLLILALRNLALSHLHT